MWFCRDESHQWRREEEPWGDVPSSSARSRRGRAEQRPRTAPSSCPPSRGARATLGAVDEQGDRSSAGKGTGHGSGLGPQGQGRSRHRRPGCGCPARRGRPARHGLGDVRREPLGCLACPRVGDRRRSRRRGVRREADPRRRTSRASRHGAEGRQWGLRRVARPGAPVSPRPRRLGHVDLRRRPRRHGSRHRRAAAPAAPPTVGRRSGSCPDGRDRSTGGAAGQHGRERAVRQPARARCRPPSARRARRRSCRW